MNNRRSSSSSAAALAADAGRRPLRADQEKVTFGYLLDPSHDAVMWAMRNGKVTSDLIEGRGDAARHPGADPGDVGEAVRRRA